MFLLLLIHRTKQIVVSTPHFYLQVNPYLLSSGLCFWPCIVLFMVVEDKGMSKNLPMLSSM